MNEEPNERSVSSAPEPAQSESQTRARTLTSAEFAATRVFETYVRSSVSSTDILNSIREHTTAVQDGNMSSAETMLMSQAIALEGMFSELATRAGQKSNLQDIQVLTQLALKAQSNARATLQTLAELKNPRQVAFVRQTNVAHNQQVNNATAGPARTGISIDRPNKLIAEGVNGSKTLDCGAAASAGSAHQRHPALAMVDRTDIYSRKVESRKKRFQGRE